MTFKTYFLQLDVNDWKKVRKTGIKGMNVVENLVSHKER